MSPDGGWKHFVAWERGLFGATKPEFPVENPPRFIEKKKPTVPADIISGSPGQTPSQRKNEATTQAWRLDRSQCNVIGLPIDRAKLTTHVMYHVMPLAGEAEPVWRRHVQWLREIRSQFNGRMIIGIVTKNPRDRFEYVSVDKVKEAFNGMDCEFFVTKNAIKENSIERGIGEGATFWEMLGMLQTSDPNSVIFYGHTKGVTKGPLDHKKAPHRWANAMFDIVFRHKDRMVDALDYSAIAGAFRRHQKNKFFSGTFFAMRAVDIFSRNWRVHQNNYGCVEFWPGNLFNIWGECECVFGDGSENLSDDSVWPEIEKKLEEWKRNPSISTKKSAKLVEERARDAKTAEQGLVCIDDLVFRKSQCESCPFFVDSTCKVCRTTIQDCEDCVSGKMFISGEKCPTGKWHRQKSGPLRRPLADPVRNLIFHIYPRIGAEWNWHWHIEQIKANSQLFNGKIAIGIVTGSGLASAETVKAKLSGVNVTDWVVKENTKQLAETATFTDLLSAVKTDDTNHVFFRGHTKGVTHPKGSTEQSWAKMMWQTCMDWPSVSDALQSHIMAGSLKSHEPLAKDIKDTFFYAGTFFWFRSDVFQRDWSYSEPNRWWAEYWPGHVCKTHEAACLCHDFMKGSVMSGRYWGHEVMPNWVTWERSRRVKKKVDISDSDSPHKD